MLNDVVPAQNFQSSAEELAEELASETELRLLAAEKLRLAGAGLVGERTLRSPEKMCLKMSYGEALLLIPIPLPP